MSYNPLTPPHSNRLLSCLCNGKTKKIFFYLGLKILIFGLIFHHGSGSGKKPMKYSYVGDRTQIFEATANEVNDFPSHSLLQSCLLPNPSLFTLHSSSLPRCDHPMEDWLWVNVNGDILPREGRERAYCKKRRNREEDWTKLRFGERLHDIIEVRCSERGDKWQNFMWRLTKKEKIEKELKGENNENLLIFELSSIGKEEFRQRFRSTISWLKNERQFTEVKHLHAASENYYIDGMFRENAPSGRFSKDSHVILIIDQENGRNLSQFAHHYGSFHYPSSSACFHTDGQHSKSLSVLSSFLSSYRLLPHFASIHFSIASSSDTESMDVDLSSWLNQNRLLLDKTTIVITAGGSPIRDSSTTHKDLLDARLPFLANSPFPQGEKRQHSSVSSSSSFVSSSEFFSSDLQEMNYRSRNCSEAGIGEEYCMCVERRPALSSPSQIQEVLDIVDLIITWINEKTLKYRFRCEVLTLDEIVDATKMSISPSALRLPIHGKMDRYFIEEEFTQFTIRFRTKQGRKLFSATVVYFSSDRVVEIDHESLRLISEEKNGDCSLSFPSIAQFCSCKSLGMSIFRHFLG